jgi:uncharacterized protein (TIGR02646 family)
MISIAKPQDGPSSLAAGLVETASNLALYDADPSAYRNGIRKFKFISGIYGSVSVKNALKAAQHNKCCYCEAIFEANYAGDVDHYRPKGAVGAGKKRITPGYYWLAYSWSNLYYACADCNQYRKRANFPLVDEDKRAIDHHGNISDEDPLILDPGGAQNPRDHIRFKQDVPTWSTSVGKATVDRIKLDREALCTSRRKHFRILEGLIQVIRLCQNDQRPEWVEAAREARVSLAHSVRPEAEFSAASRDFLEPHRNLWEPA